MDQQRFVKEINDIGFTVHENAFDKDCISELNELSLIHI